MLQRLQRTDQFVTPGSSISPHLCTEHGVRKINVLVHSSMTQWQVWIDHSWTVLVDPSLKLYTYACSSWKTAYCFGTLKSGLNVLFDCMWVGDPGFCHRGFKHAGLWFWNNSSMLWGSKITDRNTHKCYQCIKCRFSRSGFSSLVKPQILPSSLECWVSLLSICTVGNISWKKNQSINFCAMRPGVSNRQVPLMI